MYLRNVLVLLTLCLFLPFNTYAAVYKCTDKNGKTSYKDRPCAVNQKKQTVNIRKVKKLTSASSKNKNAFFEAQDRRLNERNQAQNNPSYMATPKALNIKPSSQINVRKKMNNKKFANYMKTKERTGATMTQDEKNWRNWDKNKMKKAVKKYNKSMSAEGLKQQQLQLEQNQRRENKAWNNLKKEVHE